MANPLVSVIIPAYNAQGFIGQTIESVINQTYPHWEMLVVDDGSIDDTAAVVHSYLSDSRIRYLHQSNQERAVARNHGIRSSSGQYIAFLDADDLWSATKLQTQVERLEYQPELGLCFSSYLVIDRDGLPSGKPRIKFTLAKNPFIQLLETGNFIANSTVMLPRLVLDKVGLFDETLPIFGCEDWDMWLRIAQIYPIYFIDQPLMYYRLHESNTSLVNLGRSGEAVLQKIFTNPISSTFIIKDRNKIFASFYFQLSQAYLRMDQKKAAIKHWWLALNLYPLGLVTTKQGIMTTLKLLLPHSLVSDLVRVRL
ncbi:MAG: glycosyltransferase family A protein [Anaerolineae bacterium]